MIANIGKGVPEDIGSGNGVLLSFARQRMIFSSGEDVIRICELDRMKSGGERHDGGDREVDFSGGEKRKAIIRERQVGNHDARRLSEKLPGKVGKD